LIEQKQFADACMIRRQKAVHQNLIRSARFAFDRHIRCKIFAWVGKDNASPGVQCGRAGGYFRKTSSSCYAPALRQAEAGAAVANATDVAKAAAGMVLTSPGLGGVVTAIETSRRVFQGIITYTMAMLTTKIEMIWRCWLFDCW